MAWTFTVTNLNEYVARSIAGDPMLRDIKVTGEISNFKNHTSGHWYFELKDENCRIACVMYRQYHQMRTLLPKDGDRVTLSGSVGLYTVTGKYQFYAQGMQKDGMGELFQRFQILKEKLLREGIFDQARKKPLPLFPRTVTVVTSRTGAVIHDIRNVAYRRDPSVQIILRPTLVQGENAAVDIAQGIQDAVRITHPDVIIVGRGGGSAEDLWPFNEECVVRAISNCPVPVVSAVGHEVDVTLSDLAADLRAPTPSAAAELVVADRSELLRRVRKSSQMLNKGAGHCILAMKQSLVKKEKILLSNNPHVRLKTYRAECSVFSQRFNQIISTKLLEYDKILSLQKVRLNSLSPRGSLDRGYALVMDHGMIIHSVQDMPKCATIVFHDGNASVQTLGIQKGDPFEQL